MIFQYTARIGLRQAGDDLLGAEPVFFHPCVFDLDLPAFTGVRLRRELKK